MNQQGWMKVHHKRLLDKGKIEKRVLALRFYGIQQLPKSSRKFAPRRITLSGMVNVCVIQRMRYPKFRRQHFIVGSGVIKAGCKTVIGCRLRDPVCSGPSAVPTRSSPTLLLRQRPIRGLLGILRPGRLIFSFMSRTRCGKPERKLRAVQNTTFICYSVSSICYPALIESF